MCTAPVSRIGTASNNRSLDEGGCTVTLHRIMAHFHRDAARRRVLDDVKQALTQDRSETILIRHKAPSIDHARELATALTGPMGGLRSLPGLGRRRLPCSVRLVEGEGVVVEVAVSA
jgi:hypothetical protein